MARGLRQPQGRSIWLDPLGSLLQRLGLPARCSGPWNAGRGSPKTVAVLSKPVPGLRARCVLFACGVGRRKRKAETPQLVSFRRFLASLVAWMASLGDRAPVDDWAGSGGREPGCMGFWRSQSNVVAQGAGILAAPRCATLSGLGGGPKNGG